MSDTTQILTAAQQAFLRERPHAIIATIMADGRPQLTPNWFLWDGERFWLSTLSWTVKVKNARRDPRVTLCIDGPGRRTNYVQVFGTAEVVGATSAHARSTSSASTSRSKRTPSRTGKGSRTIACFWSCARIASSGGTTDAPRRAHAR